MRETNNRKDGEPDKYKQKTLNVKVNIAEKYRRLCQ